MIPDQVAVARHYPYSVKVNTTGGSETGALDSSNIADADLKAAIEESILRSRLFNSVVQGSNGDYELSVRVAHLSKPVMGATFTVELELAWSMVKVSSRTVVMRKSVITKGVATMGEAMAAVTRLRIAVEKATQENIKQGLRAIADLDL